MACEFILLKEKSYKRNAIDKMYLWFEGKTFFSKMHPYALLRLLAAISTITAESDLECRGSNVSIY